MPTTNLDTHKPTFYIKINSGDLARVIPMTINIDERTKSVKVRVQKYAAEPRKLLNSCFA